MHEPGLCVVFNPPRFVRCRQGWDEHALDEVWSRDIHFIRILQVGPQSSHGEWIELDDAF